MQINYSPEANKFGKMLMSVSKHFECQVFPSAPIASETIQDKAYRLLTLRPGVSIEEFVTKRAQIAMRNIARNNPIEYIRIGSIGYKFFEFHKNIVDCFYKPHENNISIVSKNFQKALKLESDNIFFPQTKSNIFKIVFSSAVYGINPVIGMTVGGTLLYHKGIKTAVKQREEKMLQKAANLSENKFKDIIINNYDTIRSTYFQGKQLFNNIS